MTKANQPELPWIKEGKRYIGLREVKGRKHNITIVRWLKALRAWWRDDETPWCGVYVAHCLRHAARPIPKHWYRAKAYADAGTRLYEPHYGCIGVMSRKGGGHVCFIVGRTKDGYLVGLGGNQGNAVNLRKFPPSRFTHFVWPDKTGRIPSLPYSYRVNLPLYENNLKISKNEA